MGSGYKRRSGRQGDGAERLTLRAREDDLGQGSGGCVHLPATMMRISFTKAHGTRNVCLLTWTSESPRENTGAAARAICSRHTGIGADGWILVSPTSGDVPYHAEIRLLNADGSHAEI